MNSSRLPAMEEECGVFKLKTNLQRGGRGDKERRSGGAEEERKEETTNGGGGGGGGGGGREEEKALVFKIIMPQSMTMELKFFLKF